MRIKGFLTERVFFLLSSELFPLLVINNSYASRLCPSGISEGYRYVLSVSWDIVIGFELHSIVNNLNILNHFRCSWPNQIIEFDNVRRAPYGSAQIAFRIHCSRGVCCPIVVKEVSEHGYGFITRASGQWIIIPCMRDSGTRRSRQMQRRNPLIASS